MSASEKAEVIIIVLKRVGKWIFYTALVIIAIISGFIGYEKYSNYLDSKPKLITGLNSIELGEKLTDVLFKNKGYMKAQSEDGGQIGEFFYENKENGGSFFVTNNFVVHINRYCMDKYEYTNVNGITCNSSGEDIVEKYGKDLRIQCLTDKNDKYYVEHRAYDVSKYGIRYHLLSNKVLAFSVTTPEKLVNYTGKTWIPCQ